MSPADWRLCSCSGSARACQAVWCLWGCGRQAVHRLNRPRWESSATKRREQLGWCCSCWCWGCSGIALLFLLLLWMLLLLRPCSDCSSCSCWHLPDDSKVASLWLLLLLVLLVMLQRGLYTAMPTSSIGAVIRSLP